jgi:hypothetical protein
VDAGRRRGLHPAGFTLDSPACVILGSVLHFLDYPSARRVTAAFIGALVPGSYVVISVGRGDGRAGEDFESTYNAQRGGSQTGRPRSWRASAGRHNLER